jgi:hypothetical protein
LKYVILEILAFLFSSGLHKQESDTEEVIREAVDYFVDQGTEKVVNDSSLPEETKTATKNALMC